MSMQMLVGFGGISINAQWMGNQSEAMAILDDSGLTAMDGLSVGFYPYL